MTSSPTRRIIVGLAGPEGVGKSTIAEMIKDAVPIKTDFRAVVYRASFATPLYDALSAICRVTVEEIRAQKDKVFTAETAPVPCLIGLSYRIMLQKLGEELGRKQIHPDFWAQLAAIRQKVWPGKINVIVFDDVRYENEARQCDVVFELKRPGIDYARVHPSNMGLPEHVKRHVVHGGPAGAMTHHILDALAL